MVVDGDYCRRKVDVGWPGCLHICTNNIIVLNNPELSIIYTINITHTDKHTDNRYSYTQTYTKTHM